MFSKNKKKSTKVTQKKADNKAVLKKKKIFLQFDKILEKIITKYFEIKDKENFSTKEKILFFKQLSYLLKGGVSIREAVEVIQSQTQNFAVKSICKNILKYLNEGRSLNFAISQQPEFFDDTDIAIIKTGEKSGNLALVLNSLAEEYNYLLNLKSSYQGALMYPVFLIILSFGIIIVMFTYVLPSVFDTILGMGINDIPKTTMILKKTSDFFIQNGKLIFLTIIALFFIFSILLSTYNGKKFFWKTVLTLPLIGKISQYYFLIKFLRYFKIMLESGMSYYEIFYLLKDVLHIPIYQDMIEEILIGIRNGGTIYENLKNRYELIPADAQTMIKVGEETATLPKTIGNIIEIYQKELDGLISTTSKLMEPILLVVIGVVVGFISIGIFQLIYKLMDAVNL